MAPFRRGYLCPSGRGAAAPLLKFVCGCQRTQGPLQSGHEKGMATVAVREGERGEVKKHIIFLSVILLLLFSPAKAQDYGDYWLGMDATGKMANMLGYTNAIAIVCNVYWENPKEPIPKGILSLCQAQPRNGSHLAQTIKIVDGLYTIDIYQELAPFTLFETVFNYLNGSISKDQSIRILMTLANDNIKRRI